MRDLKSIPATTRVLPRLLPAPQAGWPARKVSRDVKRRNVKWLGYLPSRQGSRVVGR